jgi:glycosyltransferase involved in cell wall biosynthesis
MAHLMTHPVDVALVFNAANAPFLPPLRARRIPFATHVDGLEWRRAKWGPNGRRYYRTAEALAVRWSDVLIADAQGIADYYRAEFSAGSVLIRYGAPLLTSDFVERLVEFDLERRRFHLVVARFEPENHVAEIVAGYVRSSAQAPLVVVGSAPYADEYTARIRALADDRVRLVGAVWDQQLLDALYANCVTYLHGHSVGGTNPSLLRAIGAGAATIAFDVSFNREVLGDSGRFFIDEADVANLVTAAEADLAANAQYGAAAKERARDYDWDEVADRYEDLCRRLQVADFPAQRPSGRRNRMIANSSHR